MARLTHTFDLPAPFTPCRKQGLSALSFAAVNKGALLRLRCALSSKLFRLSYSNGYLRDEQPQRPRLYALSFLLGRTWLCGDDHLIPDYGETPEQFAARLALRGNAGHSRYDGPAAEFKAV